jgi:phosphohistidine phosphatase
MVSSILTEVYFIRHGIAAERGTYANDDERPLVAKGVRKMQEVAARLKVMGLTFDTVLTSPLVRAQETAGFLLEAGLTDQVEIFKELAPGGNLEVWLSWLEAWQRSGKARLALVGHEPDLGCWAQVLVEGRNHNRWVLKKAGVIGLMVPEAQGAIANSLLFALIAPRFLAGS